MGNFTYETHVMQDEKRPFIFHCDLVRCGDPFAACYANWHQNIEVLWVIEGRGQAVCGSVATAIEAGDLFVINSNVIHRIVSDDMVRYYCLIIDCSFCLENDIPVDTLLFQNLIRDSRALEYYRGVVNAYARRTAFYNAGIRSAVLQLLLYLARNYLEERSLYPQTGGGKTEENIKLAIGYMTAHCHRRLTVDDIAREAGMSKYYFLRAFKKLTGTTVISFLNMLRCEHAKKMLAAGQSSVEEVAARSGFESHSYFSKVFKKYTGVLPSAFGTR